MNTVLIIIVIIAMVGAYAVYRNRKTGSNVRPDQSPSRKIANKGDSMYHAVSLKFSATACQAAIDMNGRRFLSGVAPKIPLPGCDSTECKCRFVHHDDRRSEEDRRSMYGQNIGINKAAQFADEKRATGERRSRSSDGSP